MAKKSTLQFKKTGYFFIGLLLLAFAGFWPSYFSKFFDGTADFTFYFHFHAVLAVFWILFLIVQPLLVYRKQLDLHRLIGKLSYLVVPLLYISIILLAHSRLDPQSPGRYIELWFPFKDLIIFSAGYGIAIRYRKQMAIHARGMILAGIVLIEPALVRLLSNVFFPGPEIDIAAYLWTIGLVYALFIALIIRDRNEKKGRWVFPLGLLLYVLVHSIIIFRIQLKPWGAFVDWFASLPLT
ncbi:MAG: hypothetical protein ACR2MM_11095 [Flavobacteriaceae bacterium]